MAHRPKPFFRSARDAWYVQLGKRQIKLCPGPETAETETAAWEAFHKLMAAPPAVKLPAPPVSGLSAAALFDKFLDWTQRHRAPATYDWYRKHAQDFLDALKDPHMPAASVRPFHVTEWADSHAGWGDTYRRGAVIGIARAFNWAVKIGHLDKNPVAGVEKPEAKRREQAITPADFAAILTHYPEGDPFRELLVFCWETGCRPQEAKRAEARHLTPGAVVFPKEEAKGKKRPRRILLTPAAEALALRLAGKNPAGPLFRNEDGNPWTSYAVSCRFARLKKKTGVKFAQYAFRHGWCQKMLEAGVDHLTVAELMGHANGVMVATTYQHLGKADQHLRDALDKGTNHRS